MLVCYLFGMLFFGILVCCLECLFMLALGYAQMSMLILGVWIRKTSILFTGGRGQLGLLMLYQRFYHTAHSKEYAFYRKNNYHIIISNNKNTSTNTIATKINFHNIPFERAGNMLSIFLPPTPVKSEEKRKLGFYFWGRKVRPSLEPWGRRTAVPSLFPPIGQHAPSWRGLCTSRGHR